MSGAAVRTAYRLNVNKTKFYRLAKEKYPEIGPMKAAAFIKYPRSRDYALDFKAGEHYHHLFLSVCGGQARLGEDHKDELETLCELCLLENPNARRYWK